jgi:hypothetical protein
MWLVLFGLPALIQAQAPPPPAAAPSAWTTAEDHAHMLAQLGITKLRPGPSGNPQAPNAANYDEAKANPFPNFPELLVASDGTKITRASQWWERRRPEIVALFEREVYGRIPASVPKVSWTVAETVETLVAGRPVVGKKLVGRVDNSSHPAIEVNIDLVLVTPADARHVPVMIMFRPGRLPPRPGESAPPEPRFGPPPAPGGDPPGHEQLIAAGWGYAHLNPASIQADNGAGLTKGIIGLVNKGQPRTPEQWGSLRAWSWGAARALDYFETDPAVDARRVGIDGVSRYGKAALVTLAFEPRFAMGLIASAGEGGVSPFRRNFGEMVENLTGSGQYHWMAGNFLKYGAAEASFGSRNAGDIPVDAHQLLALSAPRLTFVSYGVPEKGDALWLDQQGSYMATVAAGPIFRLLGAGDLGVTEDYRTARMPPVNTGLLEGRLAWRQHDGGHTDAPSWKPFIAWAKGFIDRGSAARPRARLDQNSWMAHAQLLEKRSQGRIDTYFVGDSITRRWGATDYPHLLAHWRRTFSGWNAANFGWGADRIEHMIWRIDHGELDEVNPRAIVILAGTNNIGSDALTPERETDIAGGLKALVDRCRERAPEAFVVLTGILPRDDNRSSWPGIRRINRALERMADGTRIRYLDVASRVGDGRGGLRPGMTQDGLHLSEQGYQAWADALTPVLTAILGPRAKEDHAPPPTGDPSASGGGSAQGTPRAGL